MPGKVYDPKSELPALANYFERTGQDKFTAQQNAEDIVSGKTTVNNRGEVHTPSSPCTCMETGRPYGEPPYSSQPLVPSGAKGQPVPQVTPMARERPVKPLSPEAEYVLKYYPFRAKDAMLSSLQQYSNMLDQETPVVNNLHPTAR